MEFDPSLSYFTVVITKLKIMVECRNKVFHEFSTEIVEKLRAIHLAFQTKCKMVSNRALEIRIPVTGMFVIKLKGMHFWRYFVVLKMMKF